LEKTSHEDASAGIKRTMENQVVWGNLWLDQCTNQHGSQSHSIQT